MGRTFGPLFFFGSEDPRTENQYATNVTIFLLTDFKKLLASGNAEQPPKTLVRTSSVPQQATTVDVKNTSLDSKENKENTVNQPSELVRSPSYVQFVSTF